MITRNKNLNHMAFVVAAMLFMQVSCTSEKPSDLSKEALIPMPVSVVPAGGYFKLRPGTDIILRTGQEEVRKTAEYLAAILRVPTGIKVDVRETDTKPQSGSIVMAIDASNTSLGDEGYQLTIDNRIINLTAAAPAGIFRGVQTIRQLLPPAIEMSEKQKGPWKIPTGTITDYPDYSYRGAMLDVSRHFFSVEDVKRFTDFLAYYKMNMLHLHLSDDQGWRIEIKSWPNLALHGGSTEVGGGEGGYFTQEQYKDLVNYARDRFITIVPEIDMPGHTNAALASYAELNCDGKATELYTGTRVGFSTLCTDKEITYKFIDDVVRELAEMTPGPFIHIGGDESNATKEEDYIPFVNKVQEIVISHGKQVLGWDEIALSTLKPGSIAQHWSNVKNANLAVSQGAKILMSPARKAYLDMKYDKTTKLGLRWAGLIEVNTGYEWDPATLIPEIGKENIIGIEAPLWSETVTNIDEVEFMVFPRLPGYAEIGWTPSAKRSWDEYKERLARHEERFTVMGIDFYRSPVVPWINISDSTVVK